MVHYVSLLLKYGRALTTGSTGLPACGIFLFNVLEYGWAFTIRWFNWFAMVLNGTICFPTVGIRTGVNHKLTINNHKLTVHVWLPWECYNSDRMHSRMPAMHLSALVKDTVGGCKCIADILECFLSRLEQSRGRLSRTRVQP